MGLTDLVFPRMAVSPTGFQIPFSAERVGSPANSRDFFFTLGARRTGHGARARTRFAGSGPRTIPRQPSRAASRSAGRARSENTPAVKQNTILFSYTRLPFGELGITRGVTQAGTPQGKNYQSPSSSSTRVIPIVPYI